jgi:hypothetical protein
LWKLGADRDIYPASSHDRTAPIRDCQIVNDPNTSVDLLASGAGDPGVNELRLRPKAPLPA